MNALFETLTQLFEDEVARQKALLVLCQAQCRAVKINDTEYLEAKAADIQVLNLRGEEAEYTRCRVIESIREQCGLPEGTISLTELVACAPAAFEKRLQDCNEQIKTLQDEMRKVVLFGTVSLQRAADVILQGMEAFRGCVQLVPDPMTAPSKPARPAQAQSQEVNMVQGG